MLFSNILEEDKYKNDLYSNNSSIGNFDDYLFNFNFIEKENFESLNMLNKKSKKEKLKKEEILKRNAQYAKLGRLRKKIEINKLKEENIKLKNQLLQLRKQIHLNLCHECKKKFSEFKIFKITQNSKVEKSNTNKTLFSLISILCFILLLINLLNYFNKVNFNLSLIRKLEFKINKLSNNEITKEQLDKFNFTNQEIYIKYGDYYSLIHQKHFLRNITEENYIIKKNGIINLYENDINEDLNIENCKNCMIKLKQNNLNKNSKNQFPKFKIFLHPKILITPNYEINLNNNKNLSKYIEVDCYAIGFSINELSNNYFFN